MAFEKIKKYFQKKKLERAEMLKKEQEWQLEQKESKDEILSLYNENYVGKKEITETSDFDQTIMHTKNGPLVVTKTVENKLKHYEQELPDLYIERKICGYVPASLIGKGKSGYVYIEATKNTHEVFNSQRRKRNYECIETSYSLTYSKDGEHFEKMEIGEDEFLNIAEYVSKESENCETFNKDEYEQNKEKFEGGIYKKLPVGKYLRNTVRHDIPNSTPNEYGWEDIYDDVTTTHLQTPCGLIRCTETQRCHFHHYYNNQYEIVDKTYEYYFPLPEGYNTIEEYYNEQIKTAKSTLLSSINEQIR